MGKTAVVIIHGVGEQKPMQTVREFVRLFTLGHFRSKVDRDSDSFELRRLSTIASSDDPQALRDALRGNESFYPLDTVFYEYYWAFHYRDTQIGLVAQWLWATACGFRRVGQCKALRPPIEAILHLWLTAFALLLTTALLGAALAVVQGWTTWAKILVAVPTAGSILLAVVRPVLLDWVGDAARYFGASPSNPIERQQIREAGIKILKRLHEQRVVNKESPQDLNHFEYDRIVVVGHSLGSVVAYDLLTYYWGQVNADINIPVDHAALVAARGYVEDPDSAHDVDTWRMKQAALMQAALDSWKSDQHDHATQLPSQDAETRIKNAHLWRITDLITLGCPLTYAHFLMASDQDDLAERQRQRELPTCPPALDEYRGEGALRSFVYSYRGVSFANHVVPHHAAPFAFTRWTNVYLDQDPIGGPVAGLFGWGVKDICADFKEGGKDRRTDTMRRHDAVGAAHLRYWEMMGALQSEPVTSQCARVLRDLIFNKNPTTRLKLLALQWKTGPTIKLRDASRMTLNPGGNYKAVPGWAYTIEFPDNAGIPPVLLWVTDEMAEPVNTPIPGIPAANHYAQAGPWHLYVHRPDAVSEAMVEQIQSALAN